MFTIQKCDRCNGSGHMIGTSRWEIPMTAWAGGNAQASEPVTRLLRPHVCDACRGGGTLIQPTARRERRGRIAAFMDG